MDNLQYNFSLEDVIVSVDDDHRCLRTHTHSVVTHAPAKAYDYTMGVADARLMT